MVSKQTVTLANSIVGVSVLAMPWCYKQCGIFLATLMLMLGAVITRMVCYFLLKAGTITRRRNYEMLAWHTFGQGGKIIVELNIIGFLIGTLIAFFVVIGDLGPEIASEVFKIENNSSLRTIIMAALSLFVSLPLCLLRNLDSLSSVSTASVLFYVFLVFKILSEGLGPLFSGAYLDRIDYWRPAGVLQCIPILSMALSCQTQIFGIYESLPDPSLHKMNEIVKQAVNICTLFYFCIGFFGYIAFSNLSFGGNILMTFSPGISTQLIKLCFLLSIVFSVPLVVFPCRASLHSMIFRRVQMHHSLHDISTNHIPDGRLKFLTIFIIGFTLIVGINIPNIEIVLGLVGSTTGVVICIIFPSIMFIQVTSKQTTERLLAQIIFFTGIVTMVVSTYATLYAVEQAQSQLNDPLPDQLRVTEIIKDIRKNEAESQKASFSPDSKIVEMSQNLKDKLNDLKNLKQDPVLIASSSKPPPPKNEVNLIEVENKEKVKMKDGPADNIKKDPPDLNQDNQQQQKPQEEVLKIIDHPIYGGAIDNDIPVNLPKSKPDEPLKSEDPKPALEKESVDILKKLLEEQRNILKELKEHHEIDVQRQKETDGKSPLKADELINAVAHEEPKKVLAPDNNEKVEVLQQEKLIEKFSENIEKEKENVKIIDKIEEGLNKGIVKIEPNDEPRLNEKIKMPEPIPPNNDNQNQPIVVGEKVGKMLKKVDPQPSSLKVPDPVIQVKEQPDPPKIISNVVKTIDAIAEPKVLPPIIPLQLSDAKVQDQKQNVEELKNNIQLPDNVENDHKVQLDKKLKVPEPVKKVDRDI